MLEYAEREVLAASTLTDLMAALALDGQQTLPGLRRVVAYARLSSEAARRDHPGTSGRGDVHGVTSH